MNRYRNKILGGLSVLGKLQRPLNKPVHLQVEPSTFCDLECKFCISFAHGFTNKNLSLEAFVRIIDEVGPDVCTFAGRGEPLLNKHVPAMVDYCSQKGISSTITTNFTTGRYRAQELIEAGTDRIRISIDAATPDTYRTIRGVDKFQDILEGIEVLNALKRKQSVAIPRLTFEFVILRENFAEVPAILALAERYGVEYVNFRPLTLYELTENREDDLVPKLEKLLEVSVTAPSSSTASNLDETIAFIKNGSVPGAGFCLHPWLQVFVSWEGETSPCCAIYDNERVNFGNLFEEGFTHVWHGEKFGAIRKAFREDRLIHPSCTNCPGKGGPGYLLRKARDLKIL